MKKPSELVFKKNSDQASLENGLVSPKLDEQLQDALGKKQFEILSTIRYIGDKSRVLASQLSSSSLGKIGDNQFLLLRYHVDRINHTLRFFRWRFDLSYEYLFQQLAETLESSDLDLSKDYKMRALVSKSGELRVEAHPVSGELCLNIESAKEQKPFDIYVDDNPIIVGPFTSFKTTYRDHYNQARNRFLRRESVYGGGQEVLMTNTRGEITEGSITNVAAEIDGKWITPPLDSGALCGVMRKYLLDRGIIEEGPIKPVQLQPGTPLIVFNAIMGLREGKLIARS